MPNWCANFITFYSDSKEDNKKIYAFNKKLKKLYDKNDKLSAVLEGYGLNPDNYSCRGTITNLEEPDPTYTFFEVQTETAWGPTVEMWDAILGKYPGVQCVFVAEEPGCEYYINTDNTGRFYDYRYKIEIGYDENIESNELNKIGFGERFVDNCSDINEYLTSKKELFAFYGKLVGRKFVSKDQVEDFYTALLMISGDSYYSGLYEYQPYY